MIKTELIFILIIGTVLMCIPIAVQMKWYSIAIWKSSVVSIVLVLTGVFGSQIWYFVENGFWGGRSLYGAIFLAPLVYFPISKILNIPYLDILDFCAPAGCLTLALVKLQCLRDSCCQGIILYVNESHRYVRFPSQIVEFIAFLIIAIVLFALSSRKIKRKTIFFLFLVIYGIVRFVLSFLRETITPYAFGLSAGAFWSAIAFVIGFILLVAISISKKQNHLN